MSKPYTREWTWKTPGNHHYVRILEDGRLEWGGWETRPRGSGGATFQTVEDFLKNGKFNAPERIVEELREALTDTDD